MTAIDGHMIENRAKIMSFAYSVKFTERVPVNLRRWALPEWPGSFYR